MMLSEYLKPALGVVVAAALVGGWYWFEHRPRPEEKETPSNALVIVTKSRGNACFSDLVRVTGFIVPRREAVVGVDQEGFKVSDVLVREGETVTENQELARLTPPPAQPCDAAATPRKWMIDSSFSRASLSCPVGHRARPDRA